MIGDCLDLRRRHGLPSYIASRRTMSDEDFWTDLSHLVSKVRNEQTTYYLQLWLENIFTTKDSRNGKTNETLMNALTTCCTSIEIEKRSKLGEQSFSQLETDALEGILSKNMIFQYSIRDNVFFLKVDADDSYTYDDSQMIRLFHFMLNQSSYKDRRVKSIRRLVIPNILHGSIELSLAYNKRNSSLNIYLYNRNGLVLSKMEEISFLDTSIESSIVAYIKKLGYVCDNMEESFTQIGLDSLEMSEFNMFLMDRYHCEYGLTQSFPTIYQLTQYLQSFSEPSSLITEQKLSHYELSPQQIQFVVMNEMYSSERQQFSEIFSVVLDKKKYEPSHIHKSLMRIIMNQKILRTVYDLASNIPFHILSGTECFISSQTHNCLHGHLTIDLHIEIPVKIAITNENMESYELFFNFHHVAIDAFSISLFMNYLLSPTNVPTKQYYNCSFVVEKKDEEFWRKNLVISEKLPTEYARRNPQSSLGRRLEVIFPSHLTELLKRIRKVTNCSDFSVFTSLYLLLTHKLSFLNQMTVGISVSTRKAETSQIIGCFVNTLPLTTMINSNEIICDFMREINKGIRSISEHSSVPFRDLVKQNSPNSSFDALSLFQVLLVQDTKENDEAQLLTTNCSTTLMSKYEQTWYFQKRQNSYKLIIEYQQDIFSESYMRKLAQKFQFVLKSCSDRLESKIADIPIITNKEQRLIENIELKNRSDYPQLTIFEHFLKNQQNPSSFFAFCNDRLYYEEIKETIHQLSYDFVQQYVSFYGEYSSVDRLLVLVCKRNKLLPLYVMAAWLTGFSVLPISYEWPIEQITLSISQFSNSLIVTDHDLLVKHLNRRNICVFKHIKHYCKKRSFSRICSNDLAYLTFTSGSTGAPKAVCTSFKGHSNLALEYTRVFNINHRTIVYQVVNYAFDIFFADFSKILSNGCSCVLAKDQIPSVNELKKCSNAYIMPAYLSTIKDLNCLEGYESVHFGGEAIQPNALERLLRLKIPLFQEYGLTEQTVFSSYKKLRRNSHISELGTPYHNISVQLSDISSNILPKYGVGEITLKSMLCRGYFNKPKENNEMFSEGIMKSGDIGQFRGGKIHFLYRYDQKIKINGQFVDIEELKSFYSKLGSVSSCFIMAYKPDGLTTQLILYIIRKDEEVSENDILELSNKKLPPFMIPKIIYFLDEYPLTTNGKVDKQKLPKPSLESSVAKQENEQDEDEMSVILMRLMRKHLKRNSLSKKDNFFVNGGDSLKALLIIQDLQKLGFSIPLKDFMTCTNIAGIKRKVIPLEEEVHLECVETNKSQQRIWFLQQLDELSDAYVIKLRLKHLEKTRQLEIAMNTIRMANFSLRNEYINEKGDLRIRRLSGTECFLYFSSSPISLPSLVDLITMSYNDSSLYLFFHHIAVDGQSIAILIKQLSNIIKQDSCHFQNCSTSRAENINKQFWKEQFKGFCAKPIMQSCNRSQKASYSSLNLYDYEEQLSKISKLRNCTIYSILVAAYVSSLRQVFQVSDFVSYMTVSNRHHDNMETIGFFVETLPIRFEEKQNSKTEFLLYCKQKVLDLLDNSSDSLVDVLELLKLSSEDINCCITYQTTSSDHFSFPDVVVETILPDYAQFDLSYVFYNTEKGLELRIEYSTEMFDAEKIGSLKSYYLSNLREFLDDTDKEWLPVPKPIFAPECLSDSETTVLEIFKDTLQSKEITKHSNFFKVGGNSLLAIKLIYQLEDKFSLNIPLKRIFESPTPAQMASSLLRNFNDVEKIEKRKLICSHEVTPLQKTILKSFKLKSNKRMYDIHLNIKMKKSHSRNEIIKSLNMVIMCHQSLRLSFQAINDEHVKVYHSGTECFQNPWAGTMSSDNLFSFVCKSSRVFLLQMSHLISDGQSFAIILRDFEKSLDSFSVEADSFHNFNSWVQDQFERRKDRNYHFWGEMLKKKEKSTAFAPNFDRKATTRRITIPGFHENLLKLSERHGVTTFHVLMSILCNVLKQIHKSPMTIAFPLNLRRPEDENVVDLAINVPFITADVIGKAHFDIKYTSDRIIEAIDHSFISFDELLTVSNKSHFYDFMLMHDNYSTFSNPYMECEAIEEEYVKCPLTIQVDNFKTNELILVYAGSVVSDDYINNFVRIFTSILSIWKLEEVRKSEYDLSYQQQQMYFLSKTKQKAAFVLSFVIKLSNSSETNNIHRRFMQILQINQQLRTKFSHDKSSVYQSQLSATEAYISHQIMKTKNIKFFIENFQNSDAVTPQNPVCCLFLEFENSIYAYLALHHIVSDGWTTKLLEKDLFSPSLRIVHKLSYIDHISTTKYSCPTEEIPETYISKMLSGQSIFSTLDVIDEKYQIEKVIKLHPNFEGSPFAVCLRAISSAIFRLFKTSPINIAFPYMYRTKETEDIYGYFMVNYVISIEETDDVRKIEEKLAEILRNNYSYLELHKRTKGKLFDIYLNFRYDLEEKKSYNESLLPFQPQFPLEIDVDKFGSENVIALRSFVLMRDQLENLANAIVEETKQEVSDSYKTNSVQTEEGHIGDSTTSSILRIARRCLKREQNVRMSDSFYQLGGNSLSFIQFVDEMEDEFKKKLNLEKIRLARNFQEISELIFPSKIKSSGKEDYPLFTSSLTILKNFESYGSRRAFIASDGGTRFYREVEKTVLSIYKEINKHFLETTGQPVRNDDIIPIISKNSLEVHYWIMAIQLTGASYLPIMDDVPLLRVLKILSKIPNVSVYLGKYYEGINLKLLTFSKTSHKSYKIWNKSQISDLSYIINTSGTTGEPKGVCIEHKSLIHMMNGSTKNFWLNHLDCILQATLFVYDNSILESWMTSCNGGCLALPSVPCTPKQISLFILKHQITICLLFPAFVSILREETLQLFQHLRYWIVGAEKLPESLLKKALTYGIHTIQNYGPTETTAYALSRLMRRNDNPQNLGKVIQNCKYWIDQEGTLYLSGVGLMRGYLHTHESPFSTQKNYVFYKTGDVVVEQEDGCIIFVGRKDNQVKIRGHRVELSEIETILAQHKNIHQAKLIWNEKSQSLDAFCHTSVPSDDIMKYCKEVLPSHMLPTNISCLEQFPLTPNLKIDTEVLRSQMQPLKPDFLETIKLEGFDNFELSFLHNGGHTSKALYLTKQCQNCPKLEQLLSETPLKDLYKSKKPKHVKKVFDLRAAWIEVLGHQKFNESSDFFEVGGNSVILMKLANLIQDDFTYVEVDDLLNNLTFHQMNGLLNKEGTNEKTNIRISCNSSIIDKTLVFFHPLYGGCHIYKYIIDILMKYISNIQIICVEHPNSFKIQTLDESYFHNLKQLCSNYCNELKKDLKGEIYLMGASLGGSLAYISSSIIQNSTVIMIDSISTTSQCYSFEQHLSSVRMFVSDPSISSFHYILLNSWDLMQMALKHQHDRIVSNKPVYQLSIDGTDLGWKKLCDEVKVIQISGNHSTMLNLINSIELFEKLKEILK